MRIERSGNQSAQVTNLIEEIKALRDASEELFILLEHIWQNREDVRFKVNVVVSDEGREAIAETLCCYECEAESPSSLAQALHDGWIDISCADAEHGTNYVGWCPDCQRAHEEEERRLNAGPVHPQAVKETGAASQQAKPGTPTPNDPRNALPGESQTDTDPEQTVESRPEESSSPGSDSTSEAEAASAQGAEHGHEVLPYSSAASTPATIVDSPSEEYRKNTPLLTRMYLQRHMTDIVRAIGYEQLSREAAMERIKPLIERYGRETIEPSVNELIDVDSRGSEAVVGLKDQVRQFARGILGPPPPASVSERADASPVAGQPTANEAPSKGPSSEVRRKTRTPASICKLGALRPVTFTRKEMILEFREHLEKQGIQFEQIDNVMRTKYTDKYIGALDFIIREPGEPPELVAVRRKATTTQLHDLKEWQAIIGEGAFVSIVWLYFDGAGRTSWEVANGEVDEEPAAEIRDYATG